MTIQKATILWKQHRFLAQNGKCQWSGTSCSWPAENRFQRTGTSNTPNSTMNHNKKLGQRTLPGKGRCDRTTDSSEFRPSWLQHRQAKRCLAVRISNQVHGAWNSWRIPKMYTSTFMRLWSQLQYKNALWAARHRYFERKNALAVMSKTLLHHKSHLPDLLTAPQTPLHILLLFFGCFSRSVAFFLSLAEPQVILCL